ncbi:hypothetical protein OOJ96_17395 [Pseudomonas sp. 15FMM2]|uniref:Uncharacterized protein n=1 Tax=Pseudomonas imrae TaxID=2992837 RepID=A0ACC7PG01_9PSED
MATLDSGLLSRLLISCVLSTSVSVPVSAQDGVIVTGRNVQGFHVGRPAFAPDPYPATANANPAKQILRATGGELSDKEFAGVSSGSSITRAILPNGDLPALSNTLGNHSAGLGTGGAAGHGSGSNLGGQISGQIERGMAPLHNIGNMMGVGQ